MSNAVTPASRDAVLDSLRHSHDHGGAISAHERKTRWVVVLTFAMMVAELVVGYATNSLALTADGWHMATHAGALGTGKVHALAGYTSAVVLALIALLMIAESLKRLFAPEPIAFADALPVAVIGLAVNLASVKLLHSDEHHHHGQAEDVEDDGHGHGHEHHAHAHAAHDHAHDHHHDPEHHAHGHAAHHHDHHDAHDHEHHGHHGHGVDHNLRAAYFHVLADALTSVLAILALLGGRYWGWGFLDAVMGIIGGAVIARWSYGLCRGAAKQLLDIVPSGALAERLRSHLETSFAGTRVLDLHLWEIGPGARACIVSLATPAPQPASAYREALASVARLEHLTIEVHDVPAEAKRPF
jgi:cation diffusion facilitator family transporter